jgi:hypothetical protein
MFRRFPEPLDSLRVVMPNTALSGGVHHRKLKVGVRVTLCGVTAHSSRVQRSTRGDLTKNRENCQDHNNDNSADDHRPSDDHTERAFAVRSPTRQPIEFHQFLREPDIAFKVESALRLKRNRATAAAAR